MFAQALSIFGLVCHAAAYQQKRKLPLLIWQMFACIFFSVHFYFLGGYTGCMLNAICVLRSVVFFKEDMKKSYKHILSAILVCLFAFSFYITLTTMPYELTKLNIMIEFFPVLTVCLVTVSYLTKNMAVVRLIGLINSVAWMTYNICHMSIGGIMCECIVLSSVIIGIVRFDFKNFKRGDKQNEK